MMPVVGRDSTNLRTSLKGLARRCQHPERSTFLLAKKVFTNRREDIDEHNFFVHHGCAMKTVRWKVQDVSRRSNPFFAFDKEPHAAADDERHLLVHVGVFRRDQERHESEANDHNSFADDHLPFDAFGRMFDGNVRPVQMLSYAGNGSRGLARFRWDQRHG